MHAHVEEEKAALEYELQIVLQFQQRAEIDVSLNESARHFLAPPICDAFHDARHQN